MNPTFLTTGTRTASFNRDIQKSKDSHLYVDLLLKKKCCNTKSVRFAVISSLENDRLEDDTKIQRSAFNARTGV